MIFIFSGCYKINKTEWGINTRTTLKNYDTNKLTSTICVKGLSLYDQSVIKYLFPYRDTIKLIRNFL